MSRAERIGTLVDQVNEMRSATAATEGKVVKRIIDKDSIEIEVYVYGKSWKIDDKNIGISGRFEMYFHAGGPFGELLGDITKLEKPKFEAKVYLSGAPRFIYRIVSFKTSSPNPSAWKETFGKWLDEHARELTLMNAIRTPKK